MHVAWHAAPVLVMLLLAAPAAFAHLDHLPHYNGGERGTAKYAVHQALEPEYAGPGELAAILFSVQDFEGRDTYDIETMVEIYDSDGNRIKAFPWTRQEVGDFSLYYTFPDVGNYQLVVSIANGPVNSNTVDPARSLLLSSYGCNCERVIFNLNISESFGAIFNTTILAAVVVPLGSLGAILWLGYRSKRNAGKLRSPGELVKYAVMLSAVAGGMVHFAVYSEHGSLRLEYPIFLISAGGMQVTYGMLYIMLTLSSEAGTMGLGQYYRKTLALNLFGLAGTAVLIGLYAYSTIFPPPLSPNDRPEDVSLAGILAKSVEVFLIAGILYLMRFEKKRLQAQVPSKT